MKEPQPKNQELPTGLDDPFVWENKSDLANVPTEVRPIVDDLIDAIGDVYGHALDGALYLDGSVVSGGFRLGQSDIDAVWLSATPLADDHRERRIERLERVDLRGKVAFLDVVAQEIDDIRDPSRRSKSFVCAYNGIQIAGNTAINFDGYVPKTRGDYFMCNYSRFGYIIERCRDEYDLDDVSKMCPRNLAKRVARAIFHEAYLRGCPYEQSLPAMGAVLAENGFHAEQVALEKMIRYNGFTLNDAQKQEVCELAEQLRASIQPVIDEYRSEYATWVREWLRTVE
jgi:hypothetical protein